MAKSKVNPIKEFSEAAGNIYKDFAGKVGQQKSGAQMSCEANGGKWDPVNNVCIMPQPQPTPQPAADTGIQTPTEPTLTNPETFRDQQGNLSGITLPDGKTFLGLSPDDVNKIAGREAERTAQPLGTSPVGTAAAAQADMQRKIQTAQNIGNIDLATVQQMEAEGLNVKEYLAAGGQGAVKSALGYGAAGAAAGALGGPVGAGVGAAVGVTAGLVKGFYSDVTSNIKSQRNDLVTTKTKQLKQRKTAIQNYISAANANPAAADDYIAAANIEFSLIRRDYNTLLLESEKNLEFWGGDATPQLVDYEVYFESTEPALISRLQQAVLKPDPTRAYIDIGETSE